MKAGFLLDRESFDKRFKQHPVGTNSSNAVAGGIKNKTIKKFSFFEMVWSLFTDASYLG